MVELDERSVTQLVRGGVIILDVVGVQTAAQRTRGLVAVRGQPLPVGLHLVAGIHGRQGRRDPAGFQRVGGVGPVTDLVQTMVLARRYDGLADLLAFLVRAPYLQTGGAGHAVAQGADLATGDIDGAHIEELDLRYRAAVQLLYDLPGVRALDLEAVADAVHCLALGVAGGAVVLDDVYVIAAGLGMELDPVGARGAAHEDQFVLFQVKEDAVTDDIAVMAARHVLLGSVYGELGKTVDGGIGEQLECIGALYINVHHVMGLIEKNRRLTPGALLVAPVGEFGRNNWIDIGPYLGITQHVYRTTDGL